MALRLNEGGAFPSAAFHPVFGRREINDEFPASTFGLDWFNTAEEADMHRTETEAQIVVHHNQSIKVADAIATNGVVRNSVVASAKHDEGKPEPL